MSEFRGNYVMMPVKVICKECKTCVNLEIETEKNELIGMDGNRICETDIRCRNLEQCMRIYSTVKKWETDRPTARIEKEGGGSTWWDVCGECRGTVNSQDAYCKHCGAKFE